MTKEQIQRRLNKVNERLEYYYEKEKSILTNAGVQSYTIGRSSVTRYQYSSNIKNQIKELEDERDTLEDMIAGRKQRKAVAVVPRDW